MDIFKVTTYADDYPNSSLRITPLSIGDTVCIVNSDPVKVGDCYKGNKSLKIVQIYYEKRKWRQFWKKKKQIGYLVMFKPKGENNEI